ncbi:MAG: hypothetical protein IPF83_08710 [Rhodanobacteraceae bacterium]|nr:hypothetical protein [Rhodanobacteraceae bacterium]MBK7044880.1 hypothetical protein [Rhodanobacteraceae bacterium]MBP9154055.1 hypothetical protein [Xanthomonadales bacterium]HQW81152.1 hypothetical protein [Pseudomonadota bacterium]
MKLTPLACLASLAFLALPAQAVQPTRSAPATALAIHAPAGISIYDQTDSPGASSVTSQNFEAANDAADDAAADDFQIPAGPGWTITALYVPGVYFGSGTGPADSVDVNFYADNAGLPGALECTSAAVVPTDSAGTFTIDLPVACVLPAGTHWVSVIANMDFSVGGQWGWSERAVQSFSGSAWQNPGDFFATGCTSWGSRVGDCGVGTDPDLLFALGGALTVAGAEPSVPVPTLGRSGIVTLILLLAAGSLWLLARRWTA